MDDANTDEEQVHSIRLNSCVDYWQGFQNRPGGQVRFPELFSKPGAENITSMFPKSTLYKARWVMLSRSISELTNPSSRLPPPMKTRCVFVLSFTVFLFMFILRGTTRSSATSQPSEEPPVVQQVDTQPIAPTPTLVADSDRYIFVMSSRTRY